MTFWDMYFKILDQLLGPITSWLLPIIIIAIVISIYFKWLKSSNDDGILTNRVQTSIKVGLFLLRSICIAVIVVCVIIIIAYLI